MQNKGLIGLVIICAIHVYILSQLMFFPYPELFVYPYLTNQGLLPYQQIFDQHFPGLFFLPLNFEVLGLTNEYIARYWQYGLVLFTQLLIYIAARKIFKNDLKALLVNILYLAWQPFFQGWVLWINNILTILYLIAFILIIDIPSKTAARRLFVIGFVLGLATLFKQVALLLAGLVGLYLLYKYRVHRLIAFYIGGLILPILGIFGYFYSLGILRDFWFWTIQFNLTTYVRLGGSTPDLFSVKRILFALSPTWLAIFSDSKKTAVIVLLFLTGSFLAGGNNFDFTYFQPALPFVCLATVMALYVLLKKKYGWFVIFLYCLITIKWMLPFYQSHSNDYVFYFDNDTKKTAQVVKALTTPGEEIFVFGVTPLIYQMSETMPAGKVFVYQFPWFLNDAGDRVLRGLQESQPQIIVSDPTVQTKGQVISQFAQPLYTYIYSHYQLKVKIGSIEILEKKYE
jgi:hypothetical protein